MVLDDLFCTDIVGNSTLCLFMIVLVPGLFTSSRVPLRWLLAVGMMGTGAISVKMLATAYKLPTDEAMADQAKAAVGGVAISRVLEAAAAAAG